MTSCMKTVATTPQMMGVTRARPEFDQQHADVVTFSSLILSDCQDHIINACKECGCGEMVDAPASGAGDR